MRPESDLVIIRQLPDELAYLYQFEETAEDETDEDRHHNLHVHADTLRQQKRICSWEPLRG